MALQFFAVHSEALAATHAALQRHAQRHGLRPPGPTRALRIAQLYGHLQLRAAGRSSLVVALAELALSWRFQPRQLRQDLSLLQALGWLQAQGTSRGTVIQLSGPEPLAAVGDRDGDSHSPLRPCETSDREEIACSNSPRGGSHGRYSRCGNGDQQNRGDAHSHRELSRGGSRCVEDCGEEQSPCAISPVEDCFVEERLDQDCLDQGWLDEDCRDQDPLEQDCRCEGGFGGDSGLGGDSDRDDRDPVAFCIRPPASLPARTATAAAPCTPAQALPQDVPQDGTSHSAASHTAVRPTAHTGDHRAVVSAATPPTASPAALPAPASDDSRALLQRLACVYNQHRPATWPAYQPRGQGLRSKLRQALRQAGGADALADTLTAALQAMPPFWRHTYPQGRSGAECMAVLFCTDRGCAGLGVEFWHLFSWAQAASETAGVAQAPPNGPLPCGAAERSPAPAADALTTARRLLVWDSGVWRSQGREALLLSLSEKRELALLLEANGEGIPGTAAEQFADPEPASIPESTEDLTAAPQDAGQPACPITCQDTCQEAHQAGEAPAGADLAPTQPSQTRCHQPAAISPPGVGECPALTRQGSRVRRQP